MLSAEGNEPTIQGNSLINSNITGLFSDPSIVKP